MRIQHNEHERLLNDILRSPEFTKSPEAGKVLEFLFDRRAARHGTSRSQIAVEFKKTESNIGVAVSHKQTGLRARLDRYARSDEGQSQKWICKLLPGEGHRLEFKLNPNREAGAAEKFWQSHLTHERPILAVHNQLLFFFDRQAGYTVRFFDTNVENDNLANEELRKRHPNPIFSSLNERPKATREKMEGSWLDNAQPCYWYEGAGEMAAIDHLRLWFSEAAGADLRKVSCRHTSRAEILKSTPIILGAQVTNPFMHKFMQSEECKNLRYRFDLPEPMALTIHDADKQEQEALGKYNAEKHGKNLLLGTATDNVYFGVVSRIPNPGQTGVGMTFIASYGTLVIEQMALALTQEDRLAEILERTEWDEIPDSFEMLFSVKLAPGGMQDEAGPAQLIAWDDYAS